MSNDDWLSFGAAVFELGIPASLTVAYFLFPGTRKRAIVILGALTPFLLMYLAFAAAQLLSPSPSGAWVLLAMWVMTFAVFVSCLVTSALISAFERPNRLWLRYLIGLCSAPLVFIQLSWLT